MKLEFSEWLPDLADHNNPGAVEAKNVIPAADGYRPLPALSIITDPLDSVCIGGISAIANNGTIYNYAGSQNSLYELRQGSWIGRLNHYYTSVVGTLDMAGATADVVFS